MEEKAFRFKLNKNDGCGQFVKIRKLIEENGGEHLYDAIYPLTEINGNMNASVTYRANKEIMIKKGEL